MHKQFQKLGLFASKNLNDEASTKSKDKHIKYLFKKENGSADTSYKRKIKSVIDPESPKHSRKHKQEDKSRSHRKKSNASLDRHKKRDLTGNHASETEIFFISPEEIKKHRKKLTQSVEKQPEKERRRHSDFDGRKVQNREDDIAKFIKQHANKNNEKDDYQFLTKKEIFKIINNVHQIPKDSSTNSHFLKKFFLFDKQEQNKPEFIPVNDSKYSRKSYNFNQPSDDLIFSRFKPPPEKILDNHKKHRDHSGDTHKEKTNENYKKKHRERESVEVKESKRHHEKSHHHDDQNVRKHHKDGDGEGKNHKKKNLPVAESDKIECEDVEIFEKRKIKQLTTSKHERKVENEEKVKTKSKPRDESVDKVKSASAKKEELEQKLQNLCRVNSKRHKLCLVKNTFSIIEISPRIIQRDPLEEKKQLKNFKKYYKYDNDNETAITASSTFHTFSDSHKMYQDVSESVEDTKRHRSRSRQISSIKGSKLQLETHVSSVGVTPEKERIIKKASHSSRYSDDGAPGVAKKASQSSRSSIRAKKVVQKLSHSSKDGDRTGRRKTRPKTSKIPVPNSNKIVELARDSSPASKARRRSADLFNSKFAKDTENTEPDTQNIKSHKRRKSLEVGGEHITNKTSPRYKNAESNEKNSRPSSAKSDRPSSAQGPNEKNSRPSSAKSDRSSSAQGPKSVSIKENVKSRENKARAAAAPKLDQQGSKMDKPSTIKQSRMSSSFDRKSAKPELNKNKKISSSSQPTNDQRVVNEKGNKSPKLSNDGASSVWSKNTNRTSLSSKSDTKIATSRPVSLDRKCKTLERYSAKSSHSNSTCGDKSMDSTKNTTSFFLTKTYKDDDKLNRWQKRKLYSDTVRRNAINKNHKTSPVPPQVMEVRYLTVSNSEHAPGTNLLFKDEGVDEIKMKPSLETSLEVQQPLEGQNTNTEFYKEDLPEPCFELVEKQKFLEFFETPTYRALNDILKENSEFLQKDFSFKMEDLELCLSSDNFSSDDLQDDKDENDWFNFKMRESTSISDISCSRKTSADTNVQDLSLDSQDHILDSLSAPGSEESGYSTVKSRQQSRSFFEQPAIKALMQTPVDSYCVQVQIERSSSSTCGLEIRSIESKSLQTTTIDLSQKSIQINLSQEGISEMINFRNQDGEVKEETKETESLTDDTLDADNNDLEQEQDDVMNENNKFYENLQLEKETKNKEHYENGDTENLNLETVTEKEKKSIFEGGDSDRFIEEQLKASPSIDKNLEQSRELIIYVSEDTDEEGIPLYKICEIITRDRNEEASKENNKKKPTSRYKKFKRKMSSWSCITCYSSKE